MKKTTALLFALLLGIPAVAQAQRRSPLADAPAVRNRVELRARRAELGAAMGTSLNQDFYHAVMANVRAAFHFTDWLGLALNFGQNITPTFKTGFHERLVEVLPDAPEPSDKAPGKQTALDSMNKLQMVASAQIEFTPFTGKLSLFGKAAPSYDFYAFIGAGALKLDAAGEACAEPGARSTNTCAVVGFRPGVNFGIGAHAYLNKFIGLHAELRDILIRNNPAGRDVNGDRNADTDDLTLDNNYFVTAGIVIYLPTSADISP